MGAQAARSEASTASRTPQLERGGITFPVKAEEAGIKVPAKKAWVSAGVYKHPAMFGLGPGIEQNTHKIGECVDLREVAHAIAFMARFPSAYAASTK